MAKLISVELLEVPDEITVGDNDIDITVITTIDFHKIDVACNMEYCLHLFVYDVRGKKDPPLMMANWDESYMVSLETAYDKVDDFLGKTSVIVKAEGKEKIIKTPMSLKLGSFNKNNTYITRKLSVFATAEPAIGRVSKWSKPYKTEVLY